MNRPCLSSRPARRALLLSVAALLLLALAPPGHAQTAVDCRPDAEGRKPVPDENPRETFRADGCYCTDPELLEQQLAAIERALVAGDRSWRAAFQEAAALGSPAPARVKAELVCQLGLVRDAEFEAERAPTAPIGTRRLACIHESELDAYAREITARFGTAPRADEASGAPLAFPYPAGGRALFVNADAAGSAESAPPEFGETDPESLRSEEREDGFGESDPGDLDAARDEELRLEAELIEQLGVGVEQLEALLERNPSDPCPEVEATQPSRADVVRAQLAEALARWTQEAAELDRQLAAADAARQQATAALDAQDQALRATRNQGQAVSPALQDAYERARARARDTARALAQVRGVRDRRADAYERLESALRTALAKADPAVCQALEEERIQEVAALAMTLTIRRQHLVDAAELFDAERSKVSDWDDAEIRDETLEKIDFARQAYLDAAVASMGEVGRALAERFARNGDDGIGPASLDELPAAVRIPVEEGNPTEREANRRNAVRVVWGARRSASHEVSALEIAAGPVMEIGREDAGGRALAYVKGLGLSVYGAAQDFRDFIVEGYDLLFESGQEISNLSFGTDFDYFGTENIDATSRFLASLEFGTEPVYDTTQEVLTSIDRSVSRQAARGQAGARDFAETVGVVTGNVLSVEELPVRVATSVRAARAAREGVSAATTVGRATEIFEVPPICRSDVRTQPLTGTQRLGADEVAGSTTGSRPRGDGPDGAGRPRNEPGTGLSTSSDLPPVLAGTGTATRRTGPNGETIIELSDGRTFELGEDLGSGQTSSVFTTPNDPSIVIRITEGNAPINAAIDTFGFQLFEGLDLDAGLIEFANRRGGVFEIAADGNRSRQFVTVAERLDVSLATGSEPFTPGMIEAYVDGVRHLNDQGVIFADNHRNNFGFRQIGPDRFVLQVFDPGAFVPARSAAAARRAQTLIDAPSPEVITAAGGTLSDLPRRAGVFLNFSGSAILLERARELDPLIDFGRLSDATNRPFSTTSPVFQDPFTLSTSPAGRATFVTNPETGFRHPELRSAIERTTELGTRAASNAGPLPLGAVDGSATISRFLGIGPRRLELPDGSRLPIGPEIGRGASTVVHATNDPTRVIKITEADEAAQLLEERGATLLRAIESDAFRLPRQHGVYTLPDGRIARVVERATGTPASEIARFTPEQSEALLRALDEINDRGLVFVDASPENLSFDLTNPDEIVVEFFEGAAFLPATGMSAANARRAQSLLLAPTDEILGFAGVRASQLESDGLSLFAQRRREIQAELSFEVDDLLDFGGLQQDGLRISTIAIDDAQAFPNRPSLGFLHPELRAPLNQRMRPPETTRFRAEIDGTTVLVDLPE